MWQGLRQVQSKLRADNRGSPADLRSSGTGLPKVISGPQSHRLWRPRHYSGQTVIIVGKTPEGAGRWFEEATVVAELHNPYAPPWENRPMLLCQKPKNRAPLCELWPKLKHRD